MLFGEAQYDPCVWLQANIVCLRQESPIKNGLQTYEDPETCKLYSKLIVIVSDFTGICIRRELTLPYS